MQNENGFWIRITANYLEPNFRVKMIPTILLKYMDRDCKLCKVLKFIVRVFDHGQNKKEDKF